MVNLLVADADKAICAVLATYLDKNGYSVSVAHNSEECLHFLRSIDYPLVLCNYQLPGQSGSELIQKIKIFNPRAAILIISNRAEIREAVEAFRYGAVDYLTKPFYPEELLAHLQDALPTSQLAAANFSKSVSEGKIIKKKQVTTCSNTVIGKSPQSLEVQRYIELIAPSDMSVIINGETGTGKEFVAQSIHRYSRRANQVFVAIDCGSLPKELAGSELFGHVKGAFTGAINDKPGSFELADGGTIFLDEIGNLSYDNQIKLLRVLQERKIKRIGATKDITIDVRVLTATNENLQSAVAEGRLREDLYHRLNGFKIILAPLRERHEDITFFASHFLAMANQELGKTVETIAPPVWKMFYDYPWNGNLRELNNVIRRSVLLAESNVIQLESLPVELIQSIKSASEQEPYENVSKLKSIAWTAEREAIVQTLMKVNNNKSKASELLTIDRKTLYNKLKLYHILL